MVFLYRFTTSDQAISQVPDVQKKDNNSLQPETDNRPSKNDRLLSILKSQDAEIQFYGLVVDDQGSPLSDVEVSWSVMRAGSLLPTSGLSTGDKGVTRTDNTGKFSLQNKGISISIDSLSKEGYREGRQSMKTFGYGANTAPHLPDVFNPQQFLMIENGSPPVYQKEKLLAFDWDGKAKEFDIGVKEVEGTLVLVPSRQSNIAGLSNFYWKLIVSVKNGQVARAKAGNALLAPDSDFSDEIVLGDAESRSPGAADVVFHVKSNSGKYAELRINAYPERGAEEGMTASLSIRWNPTGGRSFD
jgi:hypothetical protein